MGMVHGGILFDLADVAWEPLATVTAEGESFTTLQLQMSLLSAGRGWPIQRPRASARRGRAHATIEPAGDRLVGFPPAAFGELFLFL